MDSENLANNANTDINWDPVEVDRSSDEQTSSPVIPGKWEKLSPEQFQKLQEYISYASMPFKEFAERRLLETDGTLDYKQFKSLMMEYLDPHVPHDLLYAVFRSLLKRRPTMIQTSSSMNLSSQQKIVSTVPNKGSGMSISDRAQSLGQLGSNQQTASLSPRDGQQSESRSDYHGSSQSTGDLVENTEGESDDEDNRKSITGVPGVNEIESNEHSRDAKNGNRTLSRKSSITDGNGDSLKIFTRDLSSYLSLLEADRPEDKLEFLFRLYDADGNGILDSNEMEAIVNQMMNVAGYLGWECSELRPILEEMMREIDMDGDGNVTLQEWKSGGMTTIPLLVLLGLDTNVRDDGSHVWRLKHFRNASYCNFCLNMLLGLGKKGLSCVFCHYTAHEKCVQNVPPSCIATYSKTRKIPSTMPHVWIQGNVSGKCEKCRKNFKSGITGCRCRWCQVIVHNRCVQALPKECNLGPLRDHMLPPTCIFPVILEQRPRRPSAVSPPTSKDPVLPTSKSSSSLKDITGNLGSNGHLKPAGKPSTLGVPSVTYSPHPRPASFQIQPLHGTRPLLVFVNPKSGGHQGLKILAKLQYALNPRQVCNLTADRGPHIGLNFFRDLEDYRILCCGGDGTAGWLMDAIDKAKLVKSPPIALLPLGTGNDLARCLAWGGGYEDGDALLPVFERISKSTEVMLDRWGIEVEPTLPPLVPQAETEEPGDPIPFDIMNNYFSIGFDASIARRFHMMREKHPEKFNSRIRNKLWYLEFITSETFSRAKKIFEHVTIWCDGELLDLSREPNLETIAILNIPSIYGGINIWGDKHLKVKKKPINVSSSIDGDPESTMSTNSEYDFVIQDIGDKMFEVVGLDSTIHAAQVYAGLRTSAIRLRQCSSCVIRTKCRFPMQIDGEPWLQPPCTIRINHHNQVPMLMAPRKKKSFFKSMIGLFVRK